MSEKFKNKYTIKSARLEGHDYSQDGMYFVTICTKNREECFGKIAEGKMILSDVGKIANEFWQEIAKHFLFVNLDEYIVMPNHLHGIIEINKNGSNMYACRDEALPRLYTGEFSKMSEISPKSGSLSVIIGSFKSIVSKMINNQHPNIIFAWQSRFYDHIIRNEESLGKIREYIKTNPKMWKRDRNNSESAFM
ncbi:MAG: transposase [Candidatus Moranbacteria bacterium]|nr:transposase [Candidatus Moranbacteria bacterium]